MKVFRQPPNSMECGVAGLRMVQHWARGFAWWSSTWKKKSPWSQARGLPPASMVAALKRIGQVDVLNADAKHRQPSLREDECAIVMVDLYWDNPESGRRQNPHHWLVVQGDGTPGMIRIGDPDGRYAKPLLERWTMLEGKGIRRVIIARRSHAR